jgi:hypothetical protein
VIEQYDPLAGLVELRAARRRNRLADIHWVDAMYQAYVTALFGLVGILFLSSFVGDRRLGAAGVRDFLDRAPAFVGLAVAAAVFVGLRSGSRGGPLALEAADVRHVLLAPIDRGVALRGPALKQLRFMLFVGALVGAFTGQLAARRLPRPTAAWVASGAAVGVVTVALAIGVAMVVAGRRAPRWVVSAIAFLLLGWSVADAAQASRFPPAPTQFLGRLAVWPLHVDLLALVPVGVAIAALAVGLLGLGRLPLEDAERRSSLVGQLRFAATLQDLRTVIVLRRQLAMELPRLRPWVALRPGRGVFLVPKRGWQGVLRWPASRMARVVILAVVAGFAMRALWDGTTPMILVAGLALYIAGLEAAEPLAQEVDHPGLRDSYPIEDGVLHMRHLTGVLTAGLVIVAVAGAVAVLIRPSAGAVAVAAVALLPAAIGAGGGAVVSVIMGAPSLSPTSVMLPPEVAGMRLVARTAWPPAMAVIGLLPVLAARAAFHDGTVSVVGSETFAATFFVLVVGVILVGWVRFRSQAKTWWAAQIAQAFPQKKPADA